MTEEEFMDNPVVIAYMNDPEVQELTHEVLSGQEHFKAWCAIVDALNKADPFWSFDGTRSSVENAVAWIASKAGQ